MTLSSFIQLFSFFFSFIYLSFGCNQMSETIEDSSAGFNGGFETTQSGLPVNWQFYTTKTTGNGEFEIATDQADFKEGKQSLCFSVASCSPEGGRFSPGLAKQISVQSNKSYKLSFWIKNKGCEVNISAGPISATTGEVKSIFKSNENIIEWKYQEFTILIPEPYDQLRFELTILKPGKFWIDDVKIESI